MPRLTLHPILAFLLLVLLGAAGYAGFALLREGAQANRLAGLLNERAIRPAALDEALSPDGRWLARRSGGMEPLRLVSTGPGHREISLDLFPDRQGMVNPLALSWSRGSDALAVTGSRGGPNGIPEGWLLLYRLNGERIEQYAYPVSPGPAWQNPGRAFWSPDGSQVAVPVPGGLAIFDQRARPTHTVEVKAPGSLHYLWGERGIFAVGESGGAWELWRVSLMGEKAVQKAVMSTRRSIRLLASSPEGSRLLLAAGAEEGAGAGEGKPCSLWVLDLDTVTLTREIAMPGEPSAVYALPGLRWVGLALPGEAGQSYLDVFDWESAVLKEFSPAGWYAGWRESVSGFLAVEGDGERYAVRVVYPDERGSAPRRDVALAFAPTVTPTPTPNPAKPTPRPTMTPWRAATEPLPTATSTPTAIPPMPPPTEPITAENIDRLVPYARFLGPGRAAWLGGGQRLAWFYLTALQIYDTPSFTTFTPWAMYHEKDLVDVVTHDDYGDLWMYRFEHDLVVWEWDFLHNQIVVTIPGGGDADWAVFSPSGRYIATMSSNFPGAINLYDLSGNLIRTFSLDEAGWPDKMTFSPDETRLAVSAVLEYHDYKIWVWDLPSGELLEAIDAKGEFYVEEIAFNPVGDRLAVASEGFDSATIRVWDFASGDWAGKPWEYGPYYGAPFDLRFSPGGDMIYFSTRGVHPYESVSGLYGDKGVLIDSRTGDRLPLPGSPLNVKDVLFSPDGLYAAVRYENETIIYIVGQ